MNDKILDFLRINGISMAAIADYIGVSRAILNNKLKAARVEKLKPDEMADLKHYLVKLAAEAIELTTHLEISDTILPKEEATTLSQQLQQLAKRLDMERA